MLVALLKLLAGGTCPHCGRPSLRAQDGDYHVCAGEHSCGVVVTYRRGSWRFPLETREHPLPGLPGLLWREPKPAPATVGRS